MTGGSGQSCLTWLVWQRPIALQPPQKPIAAQLDQSKILGSFADN
jgi:hypothetical protein